MVVEAMGGFDPEPWGDLKSIDPPWDSVIYNRGVLEFRIGGLLLFGSSQMSRDIIVAYSSFVPDRFQQFNMLVTPCLINACRLHAQCCTMMSS